MRTLTGQERKCTTIATFSTRGHYWKCCTFKPPLAFSISVLVSQYPIVKVWSGGGEGCLSGWDKIIVFLLDIWGSGITEFHTLGWKWSMLNHSDFSLYLMWNWSGHHLFTFFHQQLIPLWFLNELTKKLLFFQSLVTKNRLKKTDCAEFYLIHLLQIHTKYSLFYHYFRHCVFFIIIKCTLHRFYCIDWLAFWPYATYLTCFAEGMWLVNGGRNVDWIVKCWSSGLEWNKL